MSLVRSVEVRDHPADMPERVIGQERLARLHGAAGQFRQQPGTRTIRQHYVGDLRLLRYERLFTALPGRAGLSDWV